MKGIFVIILFVNVVIGIVGQLFLKKGLNKMEFADNLGIFKYFKKVSKIKDIVFGGVLYLISLGLWVIVLSELDLSFAYPVMSSNYFFIALVSKFYFKDKVSWKRWLSICVIILGIIIMSIGSF